MATDGSQRDAGWVARFNEAHGAMQKGDLEAAKAGYQALLMEHPEDADARHYLGLVYHQMGESAKAVREIRRSLRADKDNVFALNNLGNILQMQGEVREAIKAYRKASKADPGDAMPLCNLGVLMRDNDVERSLALLMDAVNLNPEMAEAWHNLGLTALVAEQPQIAEVAFARAYELTRGKRNSLIERYVLLLQRFGRHEAAVKLLRDRLAQAPDDAAARHMLAAALGELPDRAAAEYVANHFDSFAKSFEGVLGRLQYSAPQLVAERAHALLGDRRDAKVLDLGCGTGLAGRAVRGLASELVGVDLSTGMLTQARARGGYDRLLRGDALRYLETAGPADTFDLVLCVETLIYLGRLELVFTGMARVLAPGGFAIFTTERLADPAPDEEGRLGVSGRFLHTPDYLRRLVAEAGLTWVEDRLIDLRRDGDDFARGDLVVLRRPEQARSG